MRGIIKKGMIYLFVKRGVRTDAITKMKATSFPVINDQTWKETAIQSLRGLPFDKLVTKTIEGIELHPLYTKEQVEHHLRNEQKTMVQTIRSGIRSPDWTIAQEMYSTNAKQYLHEVKQSIELGNEAIVYDGKRPFKWEETDLQKLADLVQVYPLYAFHVDENDTFTNLFSLIKKEERKKVKGAITGSLTLPDGYHLLRNVSADMTETHYEGADIITELAGSLAKAAEETSNFRSFRAFSNQFFVRFAIYTHFFMEIAKLRAFRMLWQIFAQAYGEENPVSIPILSETSLRTYSKIDPYVNLLRAGNEAFSAVLGGTDVLTVHPHDVLARVTPASIRHARNVQLVIKEETLVQYVLDPAGGSYFL